MPFYNLVAANMLLTMYLLGFYDLDGEGRLRVRALVRDLLPAEVAYRCEAAGLVWG